MERSAPRLLRPSTRCQKDQNLVRQEYQSQVHQEDQKHALPTDPQFLIYSRNILKIAKKCPRKEALTLKPKSISFCKYFNNQHIIQLTSYSCSASKDIIYLKNEIDKELIDLAGTAEISNFLDNVLTMHLDQAVRIDDHLYSCLCNILRVGFKYTYSDATTTVTPN